MVRQNFLIQRSLQYSSANATGNLKKIRLIVLYVTFDRLETLSIV